MTAQGIEAFIRQVGTSHELKRVLQDRLVDAESVQRALSDPTKRGLGRYVYPLAPVNRSEAILQERPEVLRQHTQMLMHMNERYQRLESSVECLKLSVQV